MTEVAVAAAELEQYRRELTAYCYRMLASPFEAEDAVQETMLRAWRALDKFEGRSALRSWLYRIATNVCLDMLSGRARRALPMSFGPPSPGDGDLGAPLLETTWVTPFPDHGPVAATGDPADSAAARDGVRLAFVAALQHLPARQRAVLILRDVLRWKAAEVAEALPALTYARKRLKRGAGTPPELEPALTRLARAREAEPSDAHHGSQELYGAIGELLLVVVALAAEARVDPEIALRQAVPE